MAKINRKDVFDKFNGRCAYCGIQISIDKFHIDHISPLRRDLYFDKKHLHKTENLFPSCQSCNCSKNSLSIEDFRFLITNKIKVLRNGNSNFNILERYGLIKVYDFPVKFYFEMEGSNG